MAELTRKQRLIVEFILQYQEDHGCSPTYEEIANHFGFRSPNSVTEHVRLIRQKGFLTNTAGRARSFRVHMPSENNEERTLSIPLLGSIPAGFTENSEQEAIGRVNADIEILGLEPSAHAFALRVNGDSMNGKHILPGDIAVVEQGLTPRRGDVVAALIDGESALKTFMTDERGAFLRSENPKYPDLRPAATLLIQGVLVGLIRNYKTRGLALLLSVLVFGVMRKLVSA